MSESENEQTPAELDDLKKQLDEALKGIDALKAKNDELIAEKREAQRKAKEREEAAAQAAAEAAAKSGDVEALRQSYEEKLAKVQAEAEEGIKARDALLLERAKGDAIGDVAKVAIAGKDKGLRAYLATRVQAELKDGQISVTVLDESGKPSAASIDDLRKEIESDTASWGDVIAASYANGGGAAGSRGGGAANLKRSQMSPAEKHAFIEKNGQEAFLKLPKE